MAAESDYERFGMIPVYSSWVDAIGYDADRRALYVRYRGGAVIRYLGVSRDLYEDFMAAPSKGKWVHANAIHWNYAIVG